MTVPERVFLEANLRTLRPVCDLPESPNDDVEVRIGRGLKHPKDRGYARFLAAHGYDPNRAGLLAAKIVEEGRVRAATSKLSTEFAQAPHQLANPCLEAEAFLANCRLVRETMDGTALATGLFRELRLFEGLVFIRELRFCLAGDLSGRAEVTRIASAVWRRAVVSRGPKLSHASASHEYFLESQSIFTPWATRGQRRTWTSPTD